MEREVLLLSLAILALGLALNLHLTLAVLRRSRLERETPAVPRPGDAVARMAAKAAAHAPGAAARQPLVPAGQACALLFLSSRCDKCRARLPEVAAMLPQAEAAGLALRIVSMEPAFRLRRFLDGALFAAAHRVRPADYARLNPQLASPAYLFVNHEGVIEAAGLIGDADWQGLRAQLAQAGSAAGAAA